MEDKKINITISVNEQTFKQLNNIVNYYNGINALLHNNEPETNLETIIKGAIIKLIEEYEIVLNPLTIKDDILNGEGKLRNNFQKIIRDDGLKQLDISKLTGIDKTTLSSIFNNRNQPSVDNFLRIWSVLGFPSIRRCFYRE